VIAEVPRRRAEARPAHLIYHRISDDSDQPAVSPETFKRQMEALPSGQRVVDLYEIETWPT
jgi:hypothetical protein